MGARRLRAARRDPDAGRTSRSAAGRRSAAPSAERLRCALIAATGFDDAPRIADRLKGGSVVVVDLGGCAAGADGRLLDFASGLCCALAAGLHDVAAAVVLLAPPGDELAGADARGGRLFNRL